MKVYTPVKGVSGIWANTVFTNGVGETENPNAIRYFREHGYTLEETDREPVVDTGSDSVETEVKEPDFALMSVDEMRQWMKENGYGSEIRNIRNKERLLEIIGR